MAKRRTNFVLTTVVGAMLLSTNVAALEFEFNDDDPVKVEIDTLLNYSTMWRVQGSDPNNIRPPKAAPGEVFNDVKYGYAQFQPNGNDSNRNFDTGLVSNRIAFLSEMNATWHDYGLFVRARAFYDAYYMDHNPNTYKPEIPFPEDLLTRAFDDYAGDEDDIGSWSSSVDSQLGKKFEFLDFFAYGSFVVGDRMLDLRVGRQVISWGESLAFQNSISFAQNSIDADAGRAGGTVLKEIFRPLGAVYAQYALSDSISIGAYVHYEHEGVLLSPAGSYWSEQDYLGAGGEKLLLPVLGEATRIDLEDDVKTSGQWGISLTYLLESGAELGFYNLHYHDKAPSVRVDTDNTLNPGADPTIDCQNDSLAVIKENCGLHYYTYYMEDIRLYGASFATVWGTTNVNGEISYRPNSATVLDSNDVKTDKHDPGEIVRGEYMQAQFAWVHLFRPTQYYDDFIFVGEIVGWQFGKTDRSGHEDVDLNNSNSKGGWAFRLMTDFVYKNVFQGLDVTVPFSWVYTPDGNNWVADARHHASQFSTGLKGNYMSVWEIEFIYTQFDGPGGSTPNQNFYHTRDRDNITFSLKHNF